MTNQLHIPIITAAAARRRRLFSFLLLLLFVAFALSQSTQKDIETMKTPSKAELQNPQTGPVDLYYADRPLWNDGRSPIAMIQRETLPTNHALIRRSLELQLVGKLILPHASLTDAPHAEVFNGPELIAACDRLIATGSF
ncbi:hypothetical protein M0Q28_06375 [Patescibacteria group bacterium]|nr:hypothetical protein [Patescibacteria group bacterium]